MISPLVMLNRSSCVIFHRGSPHTPDPGTDVPGSSEDANVRTGRLSRPLNAATGLAHRRGGLVAGPDLVDAIEVFRIVLALGLRLADERRGHQLMVALAVID